MSRSKKKKKRKKNRRRGRWIRRTIKVAAVCLAAICVVVSVYCVYLSSTIVDRFSGRRWSVPSRIYSDVTVIFPGQRFSSKLLVEKLRRLGYRDVSRDPTEGEYRRSKASIEIHLRALDLPILERKARSVRVDLDETGVRSILAIDSTKKLPFLELEPEELMQVFGTDRESRQLVSLDDVPQELVHAVLAAEDDDFYDHFGLDPRAIARALWVNIRSGEVRQGGSTITQQLAKNYFLTPERTLWRKLNESLIAVLLELEYPKDTILEIYLNEIYFGQKGTVSVHGVGEAARFYFEKRVAQLSVIECATLAGMIRGPNLYTPYRHPEAARKRRDQVLDAMHRQKWLDKEKLDAAKKKPIETVEYAPYTRTAPYFFDYLGSELETLYPKPALRSLGLSIFTTLDAQTQEAAERALVRGLERLEKRHPRLKRERPNERLQGAIVVMKPTTGHILAMVGGRDYGQSQFNRLTHAKRQPGSAFKPFVYLTALDRFNLTERLSNEAKEYDLGGKKKWKPKNYDGSSGGEVTMRESLAKSLNLPTVDLAMRVGLEPIMETARSFGLTTPLKPRPSLALGAFEVVPLELARAYSAFAADGVLPYALSLRSVVDDQGAIVHRRHLNIETVTSPARAFLMTSLLRSVVTEGTARGAIVSGVDFPVAGKTGTTNRYRDAWFVGYSPEILALVWVGFDNGDSIGKSAAAVALPIWSDLMKSLAWQHSDVWFSAPPDVLEATVCRESGALAVASCPGKGTELFEADRSPTEPCPMHRSTDPLGRAADGIRNALGF